MSAPSLAQARSHYTRQRRITVAAVRAVRALFKRNAPLREVVQTVATYQLASAMASSEAIATMASADTPLSIPSAFAGASSYGFPLAEPIVSLIDQYAPAPVAPLPDNWWADANVFIDALSVLIASEVQDAGRAASQAEMVARPNWQNYVRMLNPPSCSRCAILAGRIYRNLEAFQRHPQCDCVMVPVQTWEAAHDEGYVSSPRDAFDKGVIRGLSEADTKAIRDGADIAQVVNAAQGMTTADVFGRRVKATTTGTTRRSAWRKANPTRLVRLRPDAIYRFAADEADAIRLLRLYGYLK